MDPVIVVGAGPVGLCLALALTRHGVPVVVIDDGSDHDEVRRARTAVLRPDTAGFLARLGCLPGPDECGGWAAWRVIRRRSLVHRVEFGEDTPESVPAESPLHIMQHALTRRLRDALAEEGLAQFATGSRLDTLEQDEGGISAHTVPRGEHGTATWWRGSYLVGCDGQRSTVRKLLQGRFPGRTAVERHAVAAVRAELPWSGEAILHLSPPHGGEVTGRPLPRGVWRVDWLLPPRGDLVTPEALIARIRETLALWCDGSIPPYELLDTGVHTVHHRLARRWRVGRAFLAGDAAHLLGALGIQGLDEGVRDVGNLAWKLALVWHRRASGAILDSYQAERRTAVGARLRAADRALSMARPRGGWPAVRRALIPGAAREIEALLTEGRLGHGALGKPPVYTNSPLTPPAPPGSTSVGTALGGLVADVPATAPDGSSVRLWERLGHDLLVVLVAPGTAVWKREHWLGAGHMPRLAAAVAALPVKAELLVTESYPGAAAHTVLLVRPDGHLAAAMAGIRPEELYACADAVRGGTTVSPKDTADSATQASGKASARR